MDFSGNSVNGPKEDETTVQGEIISEERFVVIRIVYKEFTSPLPTKKLIDLIHYISEMFKKNSIGSF